MTVQIEPALAVRIAELLDLFSALPSTPPVLTDEARAHAATLLDLVGDEGKLRGPERGQGTWPPEDRH